MAVYHALDSVAETKNIEIDQQAYPDAAQAHVGEELGFVDWVENVDRLHFYNDSPFHDQIDSLSDFQFVALVHDWQRDFGCECKAATS